MVTAWVTFRGSGLNEIRRYVGQKGFILIEHANTERAVESIEQNGEISITTLPSPSQIIITDNGRGIDKEVERNLFSPFFTTKVGGQGIGLIFTREILSSHGCHFTLQTDNDGLTRFTITFPGR